MTGRRQPREPGRAAARGRQRPRAQAGRGTPADHQAAVPVARGPGAPAPPRRGCPQRLRRGGGRGPASGWSRRGRRASAPLFATPGMQALRAFLVAEARAGKAIYPPPDQIFAALDATPFDAVKVVILGQDPYHGPGQAHGLCFSVRPGVAAAALAAEHPRRTGERPRHRPPGPWLPAAVGASRRAAAQRRADGRARAGRLAPRQGLGGIHRCRRRPPEPRARGPGVPALGHATRRPRRARSTRAGTTC